MYVYSNLHVGKKSEYPAGLSLIYIGIYLNILMSFLKYSNEFSFPFLLFHQLYFSSLYSFIVYPSTLSCSKGAVINMPRRSVIYTDHRPARIIPPRIPPKTVTLNQYENPLITEHSTYSDIIATCTAPDLSEADSVEEYDDWIKSQKTKKVNIPDDRLSVTQSTASLIKKHNKKAKKAAKVDSFKLWQEGRDGTSPLPFLRLGMVKLIRRPGTTVLSTSYPTCGYSIIDEV
jgi:hypothetical protein